MQENTKTGLVNKESIGNMKFSNPILKYFLTFCNFSDNHTGKWTDQTKDSLFFKNQIH